MDIFELPFKETEKQIDNILSNITPDELLEELIQCGLEVTMNDEEIKAIEYWKEKLKDYKEEVIERQNDEFKGYGTLEDIAKLNYCTLHTVLNLIEKQKAEIEDIKIRKERQLNRFSKYKENIENKHEEIYEDLVQEIEKKDEIIDLMASYMWKYDCCRYEIIKEGECKNLCLEKECKEQCIKEYFENKVKESK